MAVAKTSNKLGTSDHLCQQLSELRNLIAIRSKKEATIKLVHLTEQCKLLMVTTMAATLLTDELECINNHQKHTPFLCLYFVHIFVQTEL